jgi:hypothetical protein
MRLLHFVLKGRGCRVCVDRQVLDMLAADEITESWHIAYDDIKGKLLPESLVLLF